MQALTGLFARQFGTPNYAAHGGFCSVNMAAGMIYTDRRQLLGIRRARPGPRQAVRDDRHRRRPPQQPDEDRDRRSSSARAAASSRINPVRTGYSAIADEWIPIKPGTDGALFMALLHELIAQRPHRPCLPEALHQRAAAGGAGRGRARRPVRLRPRPGQGPAGRRPQPAQQAGVGQGVSGACQGGLPRRHRRRLRPGARRPLHAGRRHARRALVPAAARACRDLHARVGRGDHRHPGRAHPQARASRWATPRCSRPSSCRSRGPMPGASSTRRRRRGRSPSTRCAAWRRTPTASRRCARWPC